MWRKVGGGAVAVALIGVLFAGMQYWAVKAANREWWWIGGTSSAMQFVDLHDVDEGRGHYLGVARNDDGWERTSLSIEWSCDRGQVRWGRMTFLDEKMRETDDSSPPPADMADWHVTNNDPMGKRLLEVACTPRNARAQVRSMQISRSPFDFTRDAFSYVAAGVSPPVALKRANTP